MFSREPLPILSADCSTAWQFYSKSMREHDTQHHQGTLSPEFCLLYLEGNGSGLESLRASAFKAQREARGHYARDRLFSLL